MSQTNCKKTSVKAYSELVLLASERDTYRGNAIENRGYEFVYMCGHMYVILYFDPHVLLCLLRVRPCPKLH